MTDPSVSQARRPLSVAVKSVVRRGSILRKLAQKEFKTAPKVSLRAAERSFALRHGFFSYSYVLYGLEGRNADDYVSDYQENVLAKQINTHCRYLDDKVVFDQLLRPHVTVARERGLLVSGICTPLGDVRGYSSIAALIEDVDNGQSLFLKPVDGASGIGVFRLACAGPLYTLNQRVVTRAEVESTLKDLNGYLVSEPVMQAAYARDLFEDSVNTVRLLTMVDPSSGEAFLAAAAHRIGTRHSAPVDNCAMGGLTARIDLESGQLGPGVSTVVEGKTLHWHSVHPDSGAVVEGTLVPRFQELTAHILRLAQALAFIPYIGWDIIVTDEGFTVLEGNDGPDLKLHQVHAPLLQDERVRRFFHHYGVIS